MDKHPATDEFDTGSYLDGSLMFHLVTEVEGDCLIVEDNNHAALSILHDRFGQGIMESFDEDLCRACALQRARLLGGVVGTHLYHYSTSGHGTYGADEDTVLMTFPDGVKIHASYGYGRAYLEPGDARTYPCVKCQKETLACWVKDCAEHAA